MRRYSIMSMAAMLLVAALKEYGSAMEMVPDNLEMKYWTAVALVNAGRLEKSFPLFKEVFIADSNWAELTLRLPKVDLLKVPNPDLEKILSLRKNSR